MILTNGQEQGLRVTIERYRHKEPYTVIAGPAGSGKSSLVRFIIDALDLPEDKVVYITYTGKASLVLRNKGCSNAITAHKLLYHAKEKPDGTFEFKPKKHLDYDYKIIVLDECSMLPEDMREAYMSIFFKDEEDDYLWKLVKAADKISALIKCMEELNTGNQEFRSARDSLEKAVTGLGLEEVTVFIEEFLPAYGNTLDELSNSER